MAGIEAKTLALGGAFTAVIFGLAAQQTLGNLIAGTVLLSARPFRVGERVRLQGGPLAGQIEGTVSSLGLLYTTFATGEDSIMVPNSVVLNVAVMPLREPEAVNLRARLRAGMTPGDLQEIARALAADAAARRAADNARGTRRRGGDRQDRRDAERRQPGASGGERTALGRLARDALSGRDAVAQEEVGVAAQDVEQLEAHGRLELGRRRGSAAPRLRRARRRRAAGRGTGTVRR